ncbi:hypothetical protein CFS9_03880 [Flavobacterium sp. CFS9]|uniref:Uncharacterized protein n=1 Tax=Flavobacterium sp. CFS9 TaxID=3143118 RepID=A0AAT9GX22_9FLAO
MNKSKIAVIVSLLIILTGFIETKFDLLQDAGLSLMVINRVKLIGLILSAVLPGINPLLTKEEK